MLDNWFASRDPGRSTYHGSDEKSNVQTPCSPKGKNTDEECETEGRVVIPSRCREDTCHDHKPKADHLTHQEKVHLDGETILFEKTA